MFGESGGGMLEAVYRDQTDLYGAFMPFLQNGGLFIPTDGEYELGEEVFALITLPDDAEPIPVAAKIAWVAPKGSTAHPQGVGIAFSRDDQDLFNRIESQLADQLHSKKPTKTM